MEEELIKTEIINNEMVESGDTLDDMTSLKRVLSRGEWITEAQQIPLEDCTDEEQVLIIKCINKQSLTDEELDQLEVVLGKYRQSIREYKPDETIQAVQDNIQHIHDCDELLEKLEHVRNEAVTTIPFNIPTKDGLLATKIDVYPITDSSIILNPNSHFIQFADQEENPLDITELSMEDVQVQQKIQQKSQEIMNQSIGDNIDTMIELISYQTALHGKPRNPEKMAEICRALPLSYLAALSTRVVNIIMDPVNNPDMDKLFQTISD